MLKTFLALILSSAAAALAAEPQEFTLKTLTAQMKFDTPELQVEPGAKVTVHFENGDDLPHNICFCDKGTDVVALAMKEMEKPEEALKRNWLPDDKRVFAHSRLLNPREKDTITFTAPDKPGQYPYVCTFPGHAMTMQGVLRVFPLGEGLKDLKFALYLGDWKHLPDFNKLTPHREGPVPDNKVQIKLDDYKNQFGLVFTGRLEAPRDGNYTFAITSDDGSRVLVDGKEVVEYDGIHPAGDIKSKSVKLKKGPHDYRLEYFQAAGQMELFAAWKGPDFDITPLSTWLPANWKGVGKKKKEADTTGMPLVVTNEALVYRNFVTGAGNRGIAVGYPGGFNLAWNAETMNLAILWRGAFIDAARHWIGRGGGAQPPLGYDVLRPISEASLPFAIFSTPSADWPKVDPKTRADGYQFKGYRLDAKRQPTFNYEWNGLRVSDRFDTEGSGLTAEGKLIRTLTIQGRTPENTWFRAAFGDKIEAAKDGSFIVEAGKLNMGGHEFDNRMKVTAPGAIVAGKNLVLPAKEGTLKVTYQWLK